MAPPRFGFFFWPYTPAYTARMVSLGESLGWDLVGIADTPGNAMDVWVALALAAERTERVSLAACVTNFVTRAPAITAGAAASVDALSGGRLILGVGTGHSGVTNVGAATSTPDAFRRGLAFTRALWPASTRRSMGRRPSCRVSSAACPSTPRARARRPCGPPAQWSTVSSSTTASAPRTSPARAG